MRERDGKKELLYLEIYSVVGGKRQVYNSYDKIPDGINATSETHKNITADRKLK